MATVKQIMKLISTYQQLLIENRTTIVIAHRLSTIRNAKRILVLTDNGIEEQGTHKRAAQVKWRVCKFIQHAIKSR